MTRLEDAGEIRRVLSDAWGLPPTSRNKLAVIETGDGRIALAWTGQAAHVQFLDFGRKLAVKNKSSIDEEWVADGDLIAVFHTAGDRLARDAVKQNDPESLQRADELLSTAILEDASDLHITVRETACVVQMRQYGEICLVKQMTAELGTRICVALFNAASDHGGAQQFSDKAMQDAVIERNVPGKNGRVVSLRIRYAAAPVYPSGFKIVLRLLRRDSESKAAAFKDLGYDAEQIRLWEEGLALPSGMILVCGTTGSGKSTTLQTSLHRCYEMSEGRINILTIENPPEYRIEGADQIPVQESKSAEGGFANVVRQAMRMDPDVIMVGEIRDNATAVATQQAVQTGHLALTTTHADHVISAIDRVIQLGMERPVVGAEGFLGLVVHQTLLPLLCPHCALQIDSWKGKESQGVVKRVLDQINRLHIPINAVRFRGPGCDRCSNRGMIGRSVVAAMLVPDFTICEHVSRGEMNLARAYWRGSKVLRKDRSPAIGRTLREQAMTLVSAGRVSPLDVELNLGILVEESPEEAAHRYKQEMQHLGRRLHERTSGASSSAVAGVVD